MAKFCLLLIACTFFLIALRAQKHGAKAANTTSVSSSPAPAAPAASGSTQLIQGFHYVLPYSYHISYSTEYIHTDTIFCQCGKDSPTAIPLTKIPDSMYIIQYGMVLKGGLYYYDKIVDTAYLDTICIAQECCKQSIRSLTTHIVTDTVERYWSSMRNGMLGEGRLRVSITQSDSGLLQIAFKENKTSFQNTIFAGDINDAYFNTDNTLHYAIPIRLGDSAANFYLKVRNKAYVRNPYYYLSVPYRVFQFGATAIPFKYRWPGHRKTGGYSSPDTASLTNFAAPSEATASINLAAYAGYKWGKTRFYYDQSKTHNTWGMMVAVFAGPSLVTLSTSNVYHNTDLSAQPSTILALSAGAAFTLEIGSFNFGIFSGIDLPFQVNSVWVYKGQPWVGFGIGFNLGMFTNATSQTQE